MVRRFALVQLCFQCINYNLYQNSGLINEGLCIVHILSGIVMAKIERERSSS